MQARYADNQCSLWVTTKASAPGGARTEKVGPDRPSMARLGLACTWPDAPTSWSGRTPLVHSIALSLHATHAPAAHACTCERSGQGKGGKAGPLLPQVALPLQALDLFAILVENGWVRLRCPAHS